MWRNVTKCVAVIAAVCLSAALCGCASESYTPPEKEPSITTPTVIKEGTLTVGVNASNAPFSADVSGKIVGLDVDVAAALADELGLNLEMVDVSTDPEAALKAGTVDIVMNLDKTDTTYSCWMSDPYIDSGVALFSMQAKATLPTESTQDTIATQSSSLSAWEVSSQFPRATLDTTSDLRTAFTDLDNGKADYVAADAIIGSYVAYTSDIDCSVIGLMQDVTGYCIGVASEKTDLKTAVQNALKAISSGGVIKVIESKWVGSALDLDSLSVTDITPVGSTTTTTTEKKDDTASQVGSNAVTFSTSTDSGTSQTGTGSTTQSTNNSTQTGGDNATQSDTGTTAQTGTGASETTAATTSAA